MRKQFTRLMVFAMLMLTLSGLAAGFAGTPSIAAPTAAVAPAVSSSLAPAQKIDAALTQDTTGGKSAPFIILLADQADVSAAYNMKDSDARGWYVYNTLKSHADRTQPAIVALLKAQGVQFQQFWAVNAILIERGDRNLVNSLAARPDIKMLEANRSSYGLEPESVANPADAPISPAAVEWGVQNINAPGVWSQGFTGQNIVIANADTGMRWTHNALKPHYRGWDGTTADHNYNWHDSIHSGGGACGANAVAPCDDQGHGTHTTGTTSGFDGGTNNVGVAYGAKWIGCRNMDQGVGSPSTYTECFQFFIAPTDLSGNNPNPALRPHVINNSWGCPTSEGCAATTLQTITENTQAAGILVEASAGNAGPGCSSVTDPIAIYAASFTTGAYDISNTMASFTSLGPVTVDGSNRRKPDISAPGVNVRSSTSGSDTSYGNLSGTSMAGPHMVGAVALLWSARPALARDITTTKTIFQNTANPGLTRYSGEPTTCGGIAFTTVPNNHFGYGRVDVLAAVNSVPLLTPTPGGATNTPLPDTATPVPATNTPAATTTPSGCGLPGAWAAGPDLPAARVRGISVYWPANGKYYILGGRTSDAAGSDVLNPTEYDPGTNTWTTKAATFPTNYVNNMAGGIITISGTQQIIAVGGSFAGGADAVGDVRLYNPATDSLTTLASDPWPGVGGANDTLPGGYAVWNNKLYIIGGFQINVQMVNTIYEFDPARADGARWQLKTATLPVQLGYVPAAAIGNYIYTAGGSTYDGAALADSTNSYRYDPAADSITTIASIPRATAETRGLNYGGKLWVLGGGRIAPNPSNEVDVYDPGTDSWSLGPAFTTARRNLMADTDGNKIYLAGGYAPTTATASFEIYTPGSLPCTPTATPTSSAPTATATGVLPTVTLPLPTVTLPLPTLTPQATGTVQATDTATPMMTGTAVPPTMTATVCPNPFVDINGNVFYNAIMYLYCRGIVNGVDATHYGPAGTASRAQFAKVVVLGFAIPSYTPAVPSFTDVPITYFAYQYIEAGYHAGILSGYDAATCAAIGAAFPCYGPNRPITRGQLTKLVVRAGGFIAYTPTSPTFPDVGPSNVFYADIETAVHYGIINGYPDGLFRPNNNIRRDEMAQIVYKGITTPPLAPLHNSNLALSE